jgi:hypothetical protein
MKRRINGNWPLLQLAHLRGLGVLVVDLEHERGRCYVHFAPCDIGDDFCQFHHSLFRAYGGLSTTPN